MDKEKMIFAWSKYPEPNGAIYTSDNFSSETLVIKLFNDCKSLDGYITSDGWAFLFMTFGIEKLLELDNESGWFGNPDINTKRSDMIYQSLISGYNPIDKMMGDYDEETCYFLTMDGNKTRINWDNIGI